MTSFHLAICYNDKFKHKWLSFRLDDIEYAKSECSKCKLKKECALAMLKEEYVVGVRAGLSEFERMNILWKEAKNQDESNWE